MANIITIDGPSGSGKGTIASLLAKQLGWHCLDSGALYRLVGLLASRQNIGAGQPQMLVKLTTSMQVEFLADQLILNGEDVTSLVRTEKAGNAASKVAAVPELRAALLEWQRDFAKDPGLIADGRDMGTVVFPDAQVKVFLTASAQERAQRRFDQLKEKGMDVILADLIADIEERDERDANRSTAPLTAPVAALLIESTSLSINEVLEHVMVRVKKAFPEQV